MRAAMMALVHGGSDDRCEHPISVRREPKMLAGAVPSRGPVRVGAPSQLVQLHGEHDLSTVDDLAAFLSAASAVSGDLIVDLSDVTFFDASTIAVLVRAHHELEAGGRSLWLRSPTPSGRRLLGRCGLTPLIEPSTGLVAV